MANKLLDKIISDFRELPSEVLLIENNDGFLFREDVQGYFNGNGIQVSSGSSIRQRVSFELSDSSLMLLLISKNKQDYLEDIERVSFHHEFFLKEYLNGYHIPTVVTLPLDTLEKLPESIKVLNQRETEQKVNELETHAVTKVTVDVQKEKDQLFDLIDQEPVQWSEVSLVLGKIITHTIGTDSWSETSNIVSQCNELYHDSFNGIMQLQNSNYLKSPKIVSHILPHLKMKYGSKKLALIVVDGLGLWQYEMLKECLPGKIDTNVINSWLPSITQLSRQAIFRGDVPESSYRQEPRNEERLWFDFWVKNGISKPQVNYIYEPKVLEDFGGVNKLALVYKDLDEMMHSSKDYEYLMKTTKLWIEKKSSIVANVKSLLAHDFTIFIATDHGNVQAKGWRSLTGREKLGTNKSGSKSERHIEYSNKELYQDFVQANEDLKPSIVQEEQALYLKDDLSFSKKDSLVSHGGAHILEMLIPFAKITNE